MQERSCSNRGFTIREELRLMQFISRALAVTLFCLSFSCIKLSALLLQDAVYPADPMGVIVHKIP